MTPPPHTEQKTRKGNKNMECLGGYMRGTYRLLWLPLPVCCPCVMQCNASCKVHKTRELSGLGTPDVSETRMSLDSLSFPPSFLPSFSCTLSYLPPLSHPFSHLPYPCLSPFFRSLSHPAFHPSCHCSLLYMYWPMSTSHGSK